MYERRSHNDAKMKGGDPFGEDVLDPPQRLGGLSSGLDDYPLLLGVPQGFWELRSSQRSFLFEVRVCYQVIWKIWASEISRRPKIPVQIYQRFPTINFTKKFTDYKFTKDFPL